MKGIRMIFATRIMGLSYKISYVRTALIICIFVIFMNHECEAKKRYRIVVLPFRDYAQMNMEEMVPDVLRSTLAQTGYFESVDREVIYGKIETVIPSDMIKLDNVRKGDDGAWTTDQVDLISRLDTKRVQLFGRNLKADYVLKGAISLMGGHLRIDSEIIGVKTKKTLSFVSAEGNPEELSSVVLKELSNKITSFCRNLNAYDDALNIISLYNQGQYTFDVSEKKLKEILLVTDDAVGIRASLMVLYLSKIRKGEDSVLEDKVIEEGVLVLRHLDQDFDEKVLEVFSTSGFDPFDEIAKIYSKRGDNDSAIEIHRKTISVYPMNSAGHYKEMGSLYLRKGLDDQAIDAFEKSLDANKGSYEVNLILVSLYERRNQPDKVLKHLEECIRYARNIEEIKLAKEKIDTLTQ